VRLPRLLADDSAALWLGPAAPQRRQQQHDESRGELKARTSAHRPARWLTLSCVHCLRAARRLRPRSGSASCSPSAQCRRRCSRSSCLRSSMRPCPASL
jgi:hypothetical protein